MLTDDIYTAENILNAIRNLPDILDDRYEEGRCTCLVPQPRELAVNNVRMETRDIVFRKKRDVFGELHWYLDRSNHAEEV